MKPLYLLITFLSIFTLSACQKKGEGPVARPPRPVTVAQATKGDVPLYLDEIGKCNASETVLILPQVTGAIVEIHFKDGAEVKKGDLLFTIDPRPYEAEVARAKASLEQHRAKAAYDEAQLKRNKELRASNAIALQAFDSAVSDAQVSKAQVAADEAALRKAEINLEHCIIRSPIDGRAGKRRVDQGNVVEANKTELLLIQRQNPIYVEFAVTEGELPKVRHYWAEGTLKVQASFANDPAKKRDGVFDFLDSGVQASTGTVEMRASVDNGDRLFWPGQFVNVRILLDTVKDAVLIPQEALQVGKKGTYVFVVTPEDKVELRFVTPGQRQGNDIVIKEGLKEGERVVLTGHLALSPGTSVKIVPTEEAKKLLAP